MSSVIRILTLLVLLTTTLTGAKVELVFMSSAPSDDACMPGPPVYQFRQTDSDAWLYALIGEANAGDRLRVEFLRPDGITGHVVNFAQVASDGSWCFDGNLKVAGQEAASNPGEWLAVGYWNDVSLFTVPFEIVTPNAADPGCRLSLSPAVVNVPADAGESAVLVGTGAGCQWTAASDVAWITITDKTSGAGQYVIDYDVAANTSGQLRTGIITVGDKTHTVLQDTLPVACTYAISPESADVTASGGGGSISVNTAAGCSWTAASQAGWITITSGAAGAGPGAVRWSAGLNQSASARIGAVTVAGRNFQVRQSGAGSAGALIYDGGVANAADYTREAAPGMIISIFGEGLAPGVREATDIPLPVELSGVAVDVIDGENVYRAPLFFVSPAQINAQMPFAIDGAQVRVRVRNNGSTSNEQVLTVVPRAPRLFTKTLDGRGEPILVHADYTVVSSSAPAKPGEIVILYLTGLGEVTPSVDAGRPGGDNASLGPVNFLSGTTGVRVGGYDADVLFAGLAPYFVGLYQINFEVPAGLVLEGPAQIEVSCEGGISQAGVSLAVNSDWQKVGQGTIGPGGGVLEAAGFRMAVPPGTFPATSAIEVYRPENPIDFADKPVSDPYHVSGLPREISGPIEISYEITHPENVQGEVYVFLGAGDSVGNFNGPLLLRGTVSNNRVTATFHPGAAGNAAPSSSDDSLQRSAAQGGGRWPDYKIHYSGAIGGSWVRLDCSGKGKFEMVLSDSTLTNATVCPIQDRLEDAAGTLELVHGLRWKKRKTWPIEVFVYPFRKKLIFPDTETWGYSGGGTYGREAMQILLNSRKLVRGGDNETMCLTAVHELFHFMEKMYDPRRDLQLLDQHVWDWFDDAGATWFEREMARDTAYVPQTVIEDNYAFLFRHGLEYDPPGDANAIQHHGYGASMFLRYLTGRYGPKIVTDVLLHVETPHSFPTGALDTVLRAKGSSLRAAWFDFCRDYMEGKIYQSNPDFPTPDLIVGSQKTKILIHDHDKAAWIANWMPDQYAATVYRVELRNLNLPDGSNLRVSLTSDAPQDAKAFVYRFRSLGAGKAPDWNLAAIVVGNDGITIENAEELEKNRESLLILVANTAKPVVLSRPVRLGVNVTSTTPLPLLKYKYVSLGVHGEHEYFERPEGETRYRSKVTVGSAFGPQISAVHVPLTWSGKHFSQNVKVPVGEHVEVEYRVSGDMQDESTLSWIEIYQRITVKENSTMYGYPYKSERVIAARATNLKNSASSPHWFRHEGCSARDHVTFTDKDVEELKPGADWIVAGDEYVKTNWCNISNLNTEVDEKVSVKFFENESVISPP